MSPKDLLLVVEDDVLLAPAICELLTFKGFDVLIADTAEKALDLIRQYHPDLVVLDLGLPDMDGLEVIEIARQFSNVPIVILTAREKSTDKVTGLKAGADDYVAKPFDLDELEARIVAVLRRTRAPGINRKATDVVNYAGLRIDYSRHEVAINGTPVHLTPIEFRLLSKFSQHPNEVLPHNFLLGNVWGPGYEDDVHILRATIWRLRQKIEYAPDAPVCIVSKPGVGYTLNVP